ncbi:MAG: hypothetical protein HYU39_09430 [Thaumarchaeota archaeon]|nr:hypothetical protein [Nitrososphaerota archaeon]
MSSKNSAKIEVERTLFSSINFAPDSDRPWGRGIRIGAPGLLSRNPSPSKSTTVRYVYRLLRSQQGVDQRQLTESSGLPSTTIEAALDFLKEQGFVQEVSDSPNAAQKKYSSRY